MFEIGFSEILLILVIALVVVGPQKLPRIAAQIGRWAGRARNMARQFSEQLESEVDLERASNWADDKNKKSKGASPPPVDTAPDTPAAADPAPPTDDTYSHAHAAGESPDATPPVAPSVTDTR